MFSTSTNKLVLSITLVVLMLFPLACSEKNTDAPDYNKVHLESWYNTQFVNELPFHGTEAKNNGTLACMKCHDIYGEGTGNIPGCFKCHFGPEGSRVPADSDWVHGLTRHREFEDDQSMCNNCHTVGRSFDTGPRLCHDCHASGETHALGQPWLDKKNAQFHGIQPQQDCELCHQPEVRCSQCHFGTTGAKAPEGSGWQHGNNDEHEGYENQIDICNQCHTLNRSYGNDPTSCHDCHRGVTHLVGQTWLDRDSSGFHGTPPQSDQDCVSCHNLEQKCSQCHFGTTGAKAPAGSGWPHGETNGHEEYVDQIDTCNQCHVLSRTYRGEPDTSCHDCHGSGATHVLGQPWLDLSFSDYHGNQSQEDCADCHNLSTDCYECHFGPTGSKSPPDSNWPHGREDNHDDQKNYYAICNQCHSLTQEYRNVPNDPECHTCHPD